MSLTDLDDRAYDASLRLWLDEALHLGTKGCLQGAIGDQGRSYLHRLSQDAHVGRQGAQALR